MNKKTLVPLALYAAAAYFLLRKGGPLAGLGQDDGGVDLTSDLPTDVVPPYIPYTPYNPYYGYQQQNPYPYYQYPQQYSSDCPQGMYPTASGCVPQQSSITTCPPGYVQNGFGQCIPYGQLTPMTPAPYYQSYYPYPQIQQTNPYAQQYPGSGVSPESQMEQTITAGISSGRIALGACSKRRIPAGQSQYRACKFTAQGTRRPMNFQQAYNYLVSGAGAAGGSSPLFQVRLPAVM